MDKKMESDSATSLPPDENVSRLRFDRLVRSCTLSSSECLESAFVCLINATGFGCEALKNLVIPGISYFAVIDPNEIAVDSNFFLEECPAGESAAHESSRLMQNLNEDVHGDGIEDTLENVLQSNPTFFKRFDVVIATNLKECEIRKLSKVLWDQSVPLVYARVLGFFGSIRIQMKEHLVLRKEEGRKLYDFRLHRPFPALKDFLESTPIAEKAPWLLVMNKYLKEWQEKYGGGRDSGRIPTGAEEREEFAALLIDSHKADETFEEAIKAVDLAFNFTGEPTDNLVEIFASLANKEAERVTEPFWILMSVIKDFIENENDGLLPLSAVLPNEMESEDKISSDIWEIYKQKALEDSTKIYEQCKKLLKDLGLSQSLILNSMVVNVINMLPYLEVYEGTPLYTEYENAPNNMATLEDDTDTREEEKSYLQSYIAFRAYERFLEKYNKPPKDDGDVEAEVERFKSGAASLMQEWNINGQINDDLTYEICNYGSTELEAVSTQIGGCASDLATKILSNEHVDLEGTLFFNGISCDARTLYLS